MFQSCPSPSSFSLHPGKGEGVLAQVGRGGVRRGMVWGFQVWFTR